MSIQENGIGSPNNPSPNHLRALEREERERKKAEASRILLSPGADLASLAELLKNPTAFTKRVSDLSEATRKNEQAAAAAKREAENLKHAERNFAMRQRAVDTEIERKQSEHSAWVAKERAEIESEKQAIAKLRAAAVADAAKAKAAAAEAARRLRIMEGASA
jgi:hypothetical protein